MEALENNILDQNKLPGSEKFTRPEEIKSLSKYLKNIREVQEEHTTLNEDNLELFGSKTGLIKHIDSLPNNETLDKIKVSDVNLPNHKENLLKNENESDKLSLIKERLKLIEDENKVNIKELSNDSVKLNDTDNQATLIKNNDLKLDINPIETLTKKLISLKSNNTLDSLPDDKIDLTKDNHEYELLTNKENLKVDNKVQSLQEFQNKEEIINNKSLELDKTKEKLFTDNNDTDLSNKSIKLFNNNSTKELNNSKENLYNTNNKVYELDNFSETLKTTNKTETLSKEYSELNVPNKINNLSSALETLRSNNDIKNLSNNKEILTSTDLIDSLETTIDTLGIKEDEEFSLSTFIDNILKNKDVESLEKNKEILRDNSESIESLPKNTALLENIAKLTKLEDHSEEIKIKEVTKLAAEDNIKLSEGDFKKTSLIEDNEKLIENTNKNSDNLELVDDNDQLVESSFKRIQQLPEEAEDLDLTDENDPELSKYKLKLLKKRQDINLVEDNKKLESGKFKEIDELSDSKRYLIADEKVDSLVSDNKKLNLESKNIDLSEHIDNLFTKNNIDSLSNHREHLNVDNDINLDNDIKILDNDFRDPISLSNYIDNINPDLDNTLEDYVEEVNITDVNSLEDKKDILKSDANIDSRKIQLKDILENSKNLNSFSPALTIEEDANSGKLRNVLKNILEKEGTVDLNEEELFNRVITLLQSFNSTVNENGITVTKEYDYKSWSSKLEALVSSYFSRNPNGILNPDNYKEKLLSIIDIMDNKTLDEIEKKYNESHPGINLSLSPINKNTSIRSNYSQTNEITSVNEDGKTESFTEIKDFLNLLINVKSIKELEELLKITGGKQILTSDNLDKNKKREKIIESILLSNTVKDLQQIIDNNISIPEDNSKKNSELLKKIINSKSVEELSEVLNKEKENFVVKNDKEINLVDSSESIISNKNVIDDLQKLISSSNSLQFVTEDDNYDHKDDIIYNRIVNDTDLSSLQDQLGKINESSKLTLSKAVDGDDEITIDDITSEAYETNNSVSIPSYKLPEPNFTTNLSSLLKNPTVKNIVTNFNGAAGSLNVSSWIRFAAEEIVNGKLGKSLVSNGTVRKQLLEETLALLVYYRDQLEKVNHCRRTRLPGFATKEESKKGNDKADETTENKSKFSSLLKKGVAAAKQKASNTLSTLKDAICGGCSTNYATRNRPNLEEVIAKDDDGNDVNIGKNLSTSFFDNNDRIEPTYGREHYYTGAALGKTLSFRDRYLNNKGMATTLAQLTDWKDTANLPGTVEELNKILKDSPYISTPTKFGGTNGRYISTTLSTNNYWEITLEPFVHNQMNGGFSYLPAFRALNTFNLRVNGINTGYNEWLPIIGFELDKARMTTKSLGLYEGEIVFPAGIEFTNELSITMLNDSYKSWSYFWRRVMEVSVYNSEPHKADYYQQLYPTPTSVDKSSTCIALYKNITWLCRVYILTPQFATIKSFNLLVVLKDFTESYLGESDSTGGDITLKFSIVGENPPPSESFETYKMEKEMENEEGVMSNIKLPELGAGMAAGVVIPKVNPVTYSTAAQDQTGDDDENRAVADADKVNEETKANTDKESSTSKADESGNKDQVATAPTSNTENKSSVISNNSKTTTNKGAGKQEFWHYNPKTGAVTRTYGDPTKDPNALVFRFDGVYLQSIKTRSGLTPDNSSEGWVNLNEAHMEACNKQGNRTTGTYKKYTYN